MPTAVEPGRPTGDSPSLPVEAKLEELMAEANKAYDRSEFDDARQLAARVLARDPKNVRMLRILVSSACIDGDSAEATRRFGDLPVRDREQMRVRCARYGVTFPADTK